MDRRKWKLEGLTERGNTGEEEEKRRWSGWGNEIIKEERKEEGRG